MSLLNSNLVVVISGSTGIGKSDVAAEICDLFRGMIVSADSVQAYQGVQIGANQPTAAELERTPHFLVNWIDYPRQSTYNAAEWTRDAIFVIQCLLSRQQIPPDANKDTQNTEEDPFQQQRRDRIWKDIQEARSRKGYGNDETYAEPILPVVVGGTMMYLQWLVHGRPADALRPSKRALQKAQECIQQFQSKVVSKDNDENDNSSSNWSDAVAFVASRGAIYQEQIQKLSGQDWYRLRRILEVAFTVEEQHDQHQQEIYTGVREGGLSSLGLDVRCFFLCPNDRMKHTKNVDQRCELMIRQGLLEETTDLALSGRLPDMAARAIGYRQALDYLVPSSASEPRKEGDQDAFQEFINEFTTATRRYAKKQMQWFRRDDDFVFVPVDLSLSPTERVQKTAQEIARMIQLSRPDYDKERCSESSLSAQIRRVNEEQGGKMKTYQFERHILKPGSKEADEALQIADLCSQRLQAKKARKEDS